MFYVSVGVCEGENGRHAETRVIPGVLLRRSKRCDGGTAGALRDHRQCASGCTRGILLLLLLCCVDYFPVRSCVIRRQGRGEGVTFRMNRYVRVFLPYLIADSTYLCVQYEISRSF